MIVKKIKKNPAYAEKSAKKQISDLLDYIRNPHMVNHDEKLECAGSFNLESASHASQKMEMIALATMSSHSKMPVDHWVLSWREDEQPTAEQAEKCVQIFLSEMGLDGHQAIYGMHKNTQNLHLHIAVNRMSDTTMKVARPNSGFDIKAAHKALAKIEVLQGWKPEKNSQYVALEDGSIAHRRTLEKEKKLSLKAQDFEHNTGCKSAQRIAQERGKKIIESAKTWQELHENLASVGLRFEKKGSGAIVFVGETAVKSSSIDRSFSFKKLCKKLGEYEDGTSYYSSDITPKNQQIIEPVSPVNKEEWQEYTAENFQKKEEQEHIHDAPLQLGGWLLTGYPEEAKKEKGEYNAQKSDTLTYRKSGYGDSRKHRLRTMSECRLAYYSEKREKNSQAILHGDERPYRRTKHYRMRWGNNDSGAVDFFTLRESFQPKKRRIHRPRFKDLLLEKGHRKEADMWRNRSHFEEQIPPPQIRKAGNNMSTEKHREWAIFNRYAHAVNAERFRITCIKMFENGDKKTFILDKKNGETKGFTLDEVQQKIGEMIRLQKRGENIYVTPLSSKKHHILIDDMTGESVKRFLKDGFKPAAIIQSSPGNYQCILTITKLNSPFDKDVGNRLTERLNREYGDKKLCGCIHPHRIPGFQNRKPKHRKEDGTYPTVQLIESHAIECQKTFNLSKKIAQEIEKQNQAREENKKFLQERITRQPLGSPEAAYKAHYANIQRHLSITDFSRVDAMIALRMRATGHSFDAVRAAIEHCAPEIREKKEARNWEQYAERTANYAFGVAGDRELIRHAAYIDHWRRIEGQKSDNQEHGKKRRWRQ